MNDQPVSRRSTPWLLPILVAAVLAAGGIVAARQLVTGDHHDVVLSSGELSGVAWRLRLSDPDGLLCMGMSGGSAAEFGASCEFGGVNDVASPFDSSQFPGGGNLLFGPAPAKATAVRVVPTGLGVQCTAAANSPAITRPVDHDLPSWAPAGKWYVVSDPGTACSWTVTFLDAAGKVVRDTNFGRSN